MAITSIARDECFVNFPAANLINEQWQGSDLVQRLRLVFDSIDDRELIWTLEDESWRGPRGYSIRILWRSLLAGCVLGVETVSALIRALHENPFLAHVCGVTSIKKIPGKYAYSGFIKRLADHKDLVEQCMVKLASELAEELSGFGEIVAVDSTDRRGIRMTDSETAEECRRKPVCQESIWRENAAIWDRPHLLGSSG